MSIDNLLEDSTGTQPDKTADPDKRHTARRAWHKPTCTVIDLARSEPGGWSEHEKRRIDSLVEGGISRNEAAYEVALDRQAQREHSAKLGAAGTGQCPRPETTVPDVVRPVPNTTEATSRGASGDPDLDGAPRASGTAPDGHRPPTLRRRYPSVYQSWLNMNKRQKDGFRVDEIWLGRGGFERFFGDMGAKPTPQHTLDRVDPEVRAYGPGLCRWADKKEQTRNRRNTVFLTDRDGVRRSLGEWAEVTGQTYDALRKRCQRHRHEWTQHEIIYGRPDKPGRFAGDPLDRTPWPGDREKKLRWERAYRERAGLDEGREDFLIRVGNERQREMIEHHPNLFMHTEPLYSADEAAYAREREVEAEYRRIVDIIKPLVAARSHGKAVRSRVSEMLKRPGNLGRDAERALDAAAFGYDCRDCDADRGDRGEMSEDEDEELEAMLEEFGL